ncbi:hypothetical protein G9Q38_13860 [Pusillimonas sp. DMV24BSW_D]|uniref:DUF6776 family protein n=1 Tax=Neopusillimonas aestuarii TaxID=2716226 RepID=UPI001407461C|nr:DUF6776 family protein [Pusillimonas sp. DMV24BSW_D]QIM50168.1 hypothetical protein G9Q38_13860 [Pusillimonas sp. DMV24BSW_D]
MALFGSSNRNTFKPTPYGATRKKRRIPRWLILMLTGIVLGAGGVLFVQTSYGPTLLTVEQAEQLRQDLNSANLDKQRLQSQLNRITHELKESQAALVEQTERATTAQEAAENLKDDVLLLAGAVAPDPRGTSPGIRAADFANAQGQLNYKLLVMQDNPEAPTFNGVMDFAVAGRYPNGRATTLDIPVGDVDIGYYSQLSGNVELPDGFTATQVTIRIRPGADESIAATRTIRVPR